MRVAVAGITAFTMLSQAAEAASLRVSPVTLELRAPRSSSVLTLRNEARRPLDIQVRVFRWTQEGGVDRLEPTTDVVASPPATRLAPKVDYLIRVVRMAKRPVAAEESYRVVVDELPTAVVRKSGTVNLVVRHSVPVFFRNQQGSGPKVSWSVKQSRGQLVLAAHNLGDSRIRLSDISIMQGGQRLGSKKGLVGYVLAGATMQWPMAVEKRPAGPTATLNGHSHLGAIHETLAIGSH